MFYDKSKLPSGATTKVFTTVSDFLADLKTHKKDVLVSGNTLELLMNGSTESQAFKAVFDGADSVIHMKDGFLGVASGCQLFTDAYTDPSNPERVFFGVTPQYILINKVMDLPIVAPETKAFYLKSKLPKTAKKVVYTNVETFLRTIAVHAGDVIVPDVVYQDIVVDPKAQSFFDPIHRREWVVRGLVGVMLNNRIFTDCFMTAGDADRLFAANEKVIYLVHRDDAVVVPR